MLWGDNLNVIAAQMPGLIDRAIRRVPTRSQPRGLAWTLVVGCQTTSNPSITSNFTPEQNRYGSALLLCAPIEAGFSQPCPFEQVVSGGNQVPPAVHLLQALAVIRTCERSSSPTRSSRKYTW